MANAETYETSDDEIYFLLNIDESIAHGIIRTDDKIVVFQDAIKYYKNGNFKIKAFEKLFFGERIDDDQIKLFILEKKKSKTVITLDRLETEHLTPKIQEHIGMLLVNEKKAPKEIIQILNTEMFILEEIPRKISALSYFDFDIRVVDSQNNLFYYEDTTGYLNDVSITATIRDSEGNILDTVKGVTSKKGSFGSENEIFIPNNLATRDAFTIQIDAIKYFEKSSKLESTSITKEFFVKPYSNSGGINPPSGSLLFGDAINGIVTEERQTITLSCTAFNGEECYQMAFSLNGGTYGSPINYNVSYILDLVANIENTLHVKFTDTHGRVSVGEIFNTVFVDKGGPYG